MWVCRARIASLVASLMGPLRFQTNNGPPRLGKPTRQKLPVSFRGQRGAITGLLLFLNIEFGDLFAFKV